MIGTLASIDDCLPAITSLACQMKLFLYLLAFYSTTLVWMLLLQADIVPFSVLDYGVQVSLIGMATIASLAMPTPGYITCGFLLLHVNLWISILGARQRMHAA